MEITGIEFEFCIEFIRNNKELTINEITNKLYEWLRF